MPYYVYIIQCDDGSFYTGYSKNLDKRVKLHMNGKGARYLRIHKPKKLVHAEEFDSRTEAMRRERKVKSLNHRQKLRLAKFGPRAKQQLTRTATRTSKLARYRCTSSRNE